MPGPPAKLLVDEAEAVGMPLYHLVLEDSRSCGLYEYRLVLVRPDLHIVWSGTTVAEPAAIAQRARGAA